MVQIFKRWAGEMSDLRDKFMGMLGGTLGQPYKLDSSKVDYKLTRGLYHNDLEKYKLGAGFAKPIIDTTVGFMGTPRWTATDEGAQMVLDEHMERLRAVLQKVNRNTLRDGDCYTRIYRKPIEEAVLFKSEKPKIDLQILPPQSTTPILDPTTGKTYGYQVITNVSYVENERSYDYDIYEVITAQEITKWYEGNDVPRELKNITKNSPQTDSNIWGFVPIIHWKNDSEEDEMFGRSDLESVEPFLKAYHDVMLNSLKNNKMHAAPKLRLRVSDVAGFLANNFGVDINNLKPGEKPRINFSGSDVIITTHENDEVEFVQANSTMSDSGTLLKFLFYCIIDVSETPEFAFGTALQSSRASVKEQMTPLSKKIERKREMLEQEYKLLARMILCMYEKANSGMDKLIFDSFDTQLEWDMVVERDMAQEAASLVNYVNALNTGITGGFISVETAIDFLAKIIPNMMSFLDEEEDEQTRILRGMEFLERLGKGSLYAANQFDKDLFSADDTPPEEEEEEDS